MKIIKYNCDYCKKEFNENQIVHVDAPVNSETDPVRAGSNIVYCSKDLCVMCVTSYLKTLFARLGRINEKFAP